MSGEIETKNVGGRDGVDEKEPYDDYRSSDVDLPIDAQVET